MKSNIALQISFHYSNHCTTIHDSFSMNKQCHRPYHESASNRGWARTNRRPRVDYTHFKIHLLEREILRDLHNEGRISISYTKVYPFRFIGGGGDFVREEEQNSARILIGTLETSGNSPGIDRIGSLYSNYGGKREGSRSIRPRQDIATKLFPRTAPRVLLLKRIGYIGNVIDAPPLLLFLACGYPSGVDLEAIMDEIRGSSLDRWRPILKGTKNIKWSFEIFEKVLQKFWNQISIGTSTYWEHHSLDRKHVVLR